MNPFRIALANLGFPGTPEESIALAKGAIAQGAIEGAGIICFPECFVPGYRGIGKAVPPPDPEFLEHAWSVIAEAAAKAGIAVILGTERVVDGALLAAALVIDQDGSIAGFQDKVQVDPSEEDALHAGLGPPRLPCRTHDVRRRDLPRRLAVSGDRPLGREARRPRRVPPAVPRSGARLLSAGVLRRSREYIPREGRPVPRAENTCYFATVNYASPGSPTTSAIVRPDGTLLTYQPYGEEGLLIADIDLTAATGLLAARCRIVS